MYMEESIRTLLAGTTALLAGHVDNPRLEAEILLAHILGKDRLFLRLHDRDNVEGEKASFLQDLAGRRLLGEPIAYLTGKREFFGREFGVARGVLIPRPETELMVETALELKEIHITVCTQSEDYALIGEDIALWTVYPCHLVEHYVFVSEAHVAAQYLKHGGK